MTICETHCWAGYSPFIHLIRSQLDYKAMYTIKRTLDQISDHTSEPYETPFACACKPSLDPYLMQFFDLLQ
jgi:hypothetical protein